MSTDLTVQKPQELLGGNPAHVRLSIDDVGRCSEIICASGLWRTRQKINGAWQDRPYTRAECWAIIMAGQSLGIAPIPAMTSFHLIEGRAEMSANLQAYFLKSSPKYDYRREFEYDEHDSVQACQITVYDKQSGEAIGVSRFTRAMAQKAGLIRQGGNWDKYAESMLFARAISNAVAWDAPDAVPMRIYGDGEISGATGRPEPEANGVVTVEGEGDATHAKVEAAVAAALDADEEVIEDAEVVEEAEPKRGRYDGVDAPQGAVSPISGRVSDDEPDYFDPASETTTAPAPFDIEGALREDLKSLGLQDKQYIKQQIAEKGWAFSHASIVRLMATRDATRIGEYLAKAKPASGVTSRSTGSQTEAVISDKQLGMLHARMSALNFTEQEKRTYYKRYAQVESGRDIKKRDFDEMLTVLGDIEDGDDTTRRAYVGGSEDS